jgi:hypothetical protein
VRSRVGSRGAPARVPLRPGAGLALGQGAYFIATGLWPIVHMRSFEAVTGPKFDRWLVKTTGGLIAAVGAALLAGASDRRRTRALPVLGAGSAAALAVADMVYVSRNRIPPVYLLDAAVELGLVAGWLSRRTRRR